MVAFGSISEMGYVSLATRDMKASIANAEKILGLTTVENSKDKIYLSAGSAHHELVYNASQLDGADHFGLIAPNHEELEAIKEKVRRGGWRFLSEGPIEDFIDEGFAFVGPEGFTWHIYLAPERIDIRLGTFGPDRFGHFTVKAKDSVAMRDFLISTFDFRVSDQIGVDAGFFLRCNPEHHGIAVVKADETALHHHAWQTESIADLGRLGDRLARSGSRLLWGPLRHGAGHNIAAYYVEPNGGVIELYTDMEMIYDKERDAIVWDADDSYWFNQWDGHMPAGMQTAGSSPVQR